MSFEQPKFEESLSKEGSGGEIKLVIRDLIKKLEKEELGVRDLKSLGIEVEFFRSSGPGGQRKNKVETAVRLRHNSLGVEAVAAKERSQARNFQIAVERFRKKLEGLAKPEKLRVPTKLPISAKEERLKEKRQKSEKKRLRQPPFF